MPGRDGTGPAGSRPTGRGRFCRTRRINADKSESKATRCGYGQNYGNMSGLGRRSRMDRTGAGTISNPGKQDSNA